MNVLTEINIRTITFTCTSCYFQVDTVKRMCIKKLPQVLVIQLKRFDYDWERYEGGESVC